MSCYLTDSEEEVILEVQSLEVAMAETSTDLVVGVVDQAEVVVAEEAWVVEVDSVTRVVEVEVVEVTLE